LLSSEPVLFLFAGFLLLYIFKFFWRTNEPKHLMVNLLMYWAVVAIFIPYADLVAKPLNDLTKYGKNDLHFATWLGLIALAIYLLGIQSAIRNIRAVPLTMLGSILSKYDGRKIILLYILVSIVSALINSPIVHIPGAQLLLSVTFLKWVLLTLLIAHSLVTKSNKSVVVIILGVETLLSFSGFWAAFKDYVLVAIGAYLMLSPKLSLRAYFTLGLVFVITFFISVVWTYSKGEYRQYLTGGERSQVIVQQNQLDNLFKFTEIVKRDFSTSNFSYSFSIGVENLVQRVSYIEFLALAIKQVPTYIPHENGKLLKSAFEHVLKPRILFPDKKPIYDSELTSKYTGIQFAGAEYGTSFSLGTVAESYVDFGRYYMFISIFFFGLWIGWMYKHFIVNGYNIIWGMCYSAPIFQFAWSFSVPSSKFLGWSITYFVSFWFFNKYLIQYLDKWLLKKAYKN
jgi:hypothetical protein